MQVYDLEELGVDLALDQLAERSNGQFVSSKVSRIETAKTAAKAKDVEALLDLYAEMGRDVSEELRAALLLLTKEGGQRGWWHSYRPRELGSFSVLGFGPHVDLDDKEEHMIHVGDASVLSVSWRKSSYSDTGAQCVECAIVDAETVAVRDSKDPHGPALLFDRGQLAAFVSAVAVGRLGGMAR
ncbi:DUF397 domain-containing protein [Streptomyces sp. NPDC017529]|uniref:DUF397 domain-containing protein n=1 Tax=Streptomyces sp. NPDC017529 TaxID=3365000 RepID=UPI0037B79CD3